jgi:YHS domain-containing protein
MKQAAAGMREVSVKDPVCGMIIDEQEARAAGQFSVDEGQTYYFCNESCKRAFDTDPARFLRAPANRSVAAADTTGTAERLKHRP